MYVLYVVKLIHYTLWVDCSNVSHTHFSKIVGRTDLIMSNSSFDKNDKKMHC